jgi:hypothetical protein
MEVCWFDIDLAANFLEGMLKPCLIFFHYWESIFFILNLPWVNVLFLETKLCCNWWNIERTEYIIVKIPSNFLSKKVMRVSVVFFVLWERCIISNFEENLDHSWISCFNVIVITPIVWKNPTVSIGMEVVDKFDLIFVFSYKVRQSLWLWFR